MVKNPPANAGDAGDMGLIPGSGRSPGEGHGNPLQYFCLGESQGQRTLVGYSRCVSTKSLQLCLTLCKPMDCSTSGLPIHHQIPELAQTHVHRVGDATNHLILCRPLLFLPSNFPSIKVFPMSQLFASGGQSIGTSASALVLPMNVQD